MGSTAEDWPLGINVMFPRSFFVGAARLWPLFPPFGCLPGATYRSLKVHALSPSQRGYLGRRCKSGRSFVDEMVWICYFRSIQDFYDGDFFSGALAQLYLSTKTFPTTRYNARPTKIDWYLFFKGRLIDILILFAGNWYLDFEKQVIIFLSLPCIDQIIVRR